MTSLSQTDFISGSIYQREQHASLLFLSCSRLLYWDLYFNIHLSACCGDTQRVEDSLPRLFIIHKDAPQILSRVEILIHQGASIFAWSNKVCVWFQTSNRILKLVIRIEKFLWRQGMIGLVTVSVCLIVSECFLWTHQICFLLGPKITLYSNKCLDMVHEGHHRRICDSVGPLVRIRPIFKTRMYSVFSIRSIFKTRIYLVFGQNLLSSPTLVWVVLIFSECHTSGLTSPE